MTRTSYNAFYEVQFQKLHQMALQSRAMERIDAELNNIKIALFKLTPQACTGSELQKWRKCFQTLNRLEDWALADKFDGSAELKPAEFGNLCDQCLSDIEPPAAPGAATRKQSPPRAAETPSHVEQVRALLKELQNHFPTTDDWDERAKFYGELQVARARLFGWAVAAGKGQ